MIKLKRTDSADTDFQFLVAELDNYLAARNGDSNAFFAQFNKIDQLKHVVLAFIDGRPVGCGAMKEYDSETMEIKRMFVPLEMRGKGIAVEILNHLEQWAKELNYGKCVLETGDDMPEAIRLYEKCNYSVIPNYGQYEDVESSVCFMKNI